MEVFVNGEKVTIHRGMSVKHALIAYDQAAYKAALAGHVRIEDENGFMIGLEGALSQGARIYVKEQPPFDS